MKASPELLTAIEAYRQRAEQTPIDDALMEEAGNIFYKHVMLMMAQLDEKIVAKTKNAVANIELAQRMGDKLDTSETVTLYGDIVNELARVINTIPELQNAIAKIAAVATPDQNLVDLLRRDGFNHVADLMQEAVNLLPQPSAPHPIMPKPKSPQNG